MPRFDFSDMMITSDLEREVFEVTVVFWVIMIALLLVFVVTLFKSAGDSKDRVVDVMIAVVCLVLMILMKTRWQ